MERNENQNTGNSKMKKGFKGLKPQSLIPIVHINSRPAVKVLPKYHAKFVGENEHNLPDFPALPSNPQKSSENVGNDFSHNTLFSKILVTKPDPQFANVKEQRVRDIGGFGKQKDFKNSPGESFRKSALENSVKDEGIASIATKGSNQDVQQAGQVSIPQNKKGHDSKDQKCVTSVPGVIRDNNCTNSLVGAGNTKRKHKRKSKKASALPQGKVNTISQEQYVAFMEPKSLKPTDASLNFCIEDQNEYPVLGLQFKGTKVKPKKETKVYEKEMELPVADHVTRETVEPVSPSAQTATCKVEVTSPLKPKKASPDKKFNSPIEMNIMDMLSKMKKSGRSSKFQPLTIKREKLKSPNKHLNLNILDSSGPTRKRGKEREVPKKPRLSKMKKVILKERVERRLRIALLSVENHKGADSISNVDGGSCIQQLQSQVQKLSLKTEDKEDKVSYCELAATVQTADVQIAATGEDEPEEKPRLKAAKKLLHCRKFREYCTHFISDEMDTLTNNLLAELVRFQDRLFLKDPVKARARKRLVCGLKEVTKNLKLRKLKVIIMAPDIEEINSEGGLNDALKSIFNFCENYHTPVIFSLPRRKLGKVCKKKVPLSCVGIFNYEGTEDIYKHLMELVDEAKHVYKETMAFAQEHLTHEMIQTLSNDQVDYSLIEKMKTEFWESQSRC